MAVLAFSLGKELGRGDRVAKRRAIPRRWVDDDMGKRAVFIAWGAGHRRGSKGEAVAVPVALPAVGK